tara:strand:- start:41994 stop:42203 length:210 start_codon:yes stop_codon:yes gene_type:complete
MCSSKPKKLKPPPVLPEAPTAPDGITESSGTDKRRRRAASGKSENSTILTSTRGTTGAAPTSTKVLLGA